MMKLGGSLRVSSFIWVAVCCLLLPGCGKNLRDFETLKLRLDEDPTTLDPAYIVDVAGGALAAKLFNGLVRFGTDVPGSLESTNGLVSHSIDIVPDIAESWSVSEDGTEYRFRLKSGVRFSSGREVNASDFKYSFERLLSPETLSPRKWLFERVMGAKEFIRGQAEDVVGIRVEEDYTLTITLAEPFAPFMSFLAMPNAYVVPEEEVERWGPDFSFHPVGTGPFVLSEWRPSNRLILVANGSYHGGPPKIERIEYRIIPENFTAAAEFEMGNLDLLEVPPAEFERYTEGTKWKDLVVSQSGLNVYYLGFNCQHVPFDNPDVRRAINHAIDREAILDTVLKNRAVLAQGPIPPGLPGYDPGLQGYRYDPAKARELLAESGLGSGLKVRLYLSADREALRYVQAVQQDLERLGLEVELRQLEWSAFKEAVNRGEPDMFYLSWQADYPDAENFLFPTFHSRNWGPSGNRVRFKDETIDGLIELAQRTVDLDERVRLYREVQRRVVEAAPWVFLWHKKEYVIRQAWVKGYKLHPIYNADNGTRVWIGI